MEGEKMRCKLCKTELNQPGKPETRDCGGDCLACMASFGDKDCIAELKQKTASV